MARKEMRIANPLVIMFEDSGQIVCHIHPSKGATHREYGMIDCDLVRHVARAFKVEEDGVWDWVDKERRNPTAKLTSPS